VSALPSTVLVVGAGLAGSRCAETLRAEGFEGRVLLIGEESAPPYERPALSKELLAGAREVEEIALRPPGFWAEQGIALLLGRRVVHVDVRARTALLGNGCSLGWDALVLATGAQARRIGAGPAPPGAHHLRTIEDALALHEELVPGARLAVVGAGFVGTEVASTAAALGVHVTLIDACLPLQRVLGLEIARLLAGRCEARGVELRTNARVTGFGIHAEGRVGTVALSDGKQIPCDAVLVGVGAVPAAGLFPGVAGAGIPTDGCGRTALANVYACGDVAAAWRPWLGATLRVEHWTGAAAQGVAVARTILRQELPQEELPYFWSDQFGVRLQYVGHAGRWARVELDGDEDAFRARYLARDGSLLAGLLANRPREVGLLRRELAATHAPLVA
jgi:3-phenylpropionate/trans-cinnamate dioxygenase ferredoxin reductase component